MNEPAEDKFRRVLRTFARPLLILAAVALAGGITFVWPERNGLGVEIDSSPRAQAARRRLPYDLSRLQVLNRVIHHVNKYYVAPERVDHRDMLLSGLDAIQRSVPPVLVHHRKGDKKFTVLVDNEQRTFSIDGVNSPWSLAQRFREVFQFLQRHLDDEDIELRDVEYTTVNGALHTLDPHSIILTPDIYTEMRMSTRGEFGGLGIVISIRDGLLTVIRPIPGTPAEQSGLHPMDRIVKIDSESTLNMPLQEAVNRLRGAPGSKVNVWIVRETPRGWSEPRKVVLERAIIHIDSVESRMLKNSIGYVRLKSFQGNTTADLHNALRKLHKQGLKGLVLDLRDNPGGLLEQAVRITDTFLESGAIVSTRSNDENQRDEKFATREGTEPAYPLVVLVNGGSASASEIVAGALKNHDRAVVIGQRTFGKGSVQVLYDYNDGSALKLTIAQYLTPGDVSIQGVGIAPDIGIDPITVDRQDMDLSVNHKRLREADLSRHLTSESTRLDDKPSVMLEYYLPQEVRERLRENAEESSEENEAEAEFLIRFAQQLLANAPSPNRRAMLKSAESVIEATREREMQRAAAELRKLGVDWSVGADQGPSDLEVKVSTNQPGNVGVAGEPFDLQVEVTNKGKVPVYQLRATTSSDNGLFDDRELVFGRIKPGQTRKWSTTLGICDVPPEAPASTLQDKGEASWRALLPKIGKKKGKKKCLLPYFAPNRADGIRIKFEEAYGHAPPPAEVRTTIKALPDPQFAYALQIDDSAGGNGDGRIQRGETATLYLQVENVGKGKTYTTEANLSNLSGAGILLKDGRFRIDNIEPGEKRSVPFTFTILPDFAEAKAKLEVSVVDRDLREVISEKIHVPVATTSQAPKPRSGSVTLAKGTIIREKPMANARAIGKVMDGAVELPAEAELAGFVRVQWDDKRPGWVSAKHILADTPAEAGRLYSRRNHMPPRIELTSGDTLVTRSPRLRVRGVARDNSRVRDVYIFVGSNKVYYKSNRGSSNPKAAEFDANILLHPGTNYVTIFARESKDSITRKTLIVRRDGKDGNLLETPEDEGDPWAVFDVHEGGP